MDEVIHLLAFSGDRRSLCNEKDAVPRLLARFVRVHERGHARAGVEAPQWCSECYAEAHRRGLSLDAEQHAETWQ